MEFCRTGFLLILGLSFRAFPPGGAGVVLRVTLQWPIWAVQHSREHPEVLREQITGVFGQGKSVMISFLLLTGQCDTLALLSESCIAVLKEWLSL